MGLPAGIQRAVTAFSNVFVQGYINDFGASCMAGWSCYHRLDQFLMLPLQSIASGATTFVGQNIGARKLDRAQDGVRTAIKMSLLVSAVLILLLNLAASPLVRIFNRDPEVVSYGLLFVHMISPLYLICSFNQIYAGALRGAGDAKAPMVMMLLSFVPSARSIWPWGPTSSMRRGFVGMGYPAGWLVCSILQALYYHKSHWRERCQAAWAAEDAPRTKRINA